MIMRTSLAALLSTFALAACSGGEIKYDTSAASDSANARSANRTERVKSVEGFSTPESVRYDEAADAWLVSNINGNPLGKDSNGFISRLTSDGTVDSLHFIMGGRNGVTLHAPKGMAIIGDTLFVADIDAVRAFHRMTGAPITSWNLAPQGALFLNDVAVTPQGDVYVSDTQVRFQPDGSMSHPGMDRIFMLNRDRKSASIALRNDSLGRPNGITWDARGNRLIIVSFGGGKIHGWAPGSDSLTIIATGKGQFDGVEMLPNGQLLVSSWADSTVSIVDGNSVTAVVRGVEAPADIGLNQRTGMLAIPLFNGNRVEIWRVVSQ